MAAVAERMSATLRHRGPDDAGHWVDASTGVAFGFRRLAILDLSPLGHQPMVSESGRYVVVFNGEIYNFKELRAELEGHGHRFRGGSDTEVILAAAEQWGFQTAVKRFNGMFAIGLWDRQERMLSLARDPLGIKPMYYGWAGKVLLFGSELKALRAHPAFVPGLNRGAAALYLRHGFVPGPYCIYRDVFKLQPGCLLILRSPEERAQPGPYWCLKTVVERAMADPFPGGEDEAIDELDRLVRQAVRRQMVADVPLGAFLSGGINSSLVTALMQAQSGKRIRTFTAGFTEHEYDESPQAAAVAAHLGTDHTRLLITGEEGRALVPTLPSMYDEPFADSSQIPTHLICRATRRHVTVCLSGDGGDELFGGYSQYSALPTKVLWLERIPPACRPSCRVMARGLGTVLRQSRIDRLQRLAGAFEIRSDYLRARSDLDFILIRYSYWRDGRGMPPVAGELPYSLVNAGAYPRDLDCLSKLMFINTAMGLPDNMLTKVDRASSWVSLEVRVPLLDQELAAFAWRLPPGMKVRSYGHGKWLLRQLLYRYVPQKLVDRPKQGFGVPLAVWLRGPLREWAEELLSKERLQESGVFAPGPVLREWRGLLRSSATWEARIWIVLSFQAWWNRWMRRPVCA